MNTAFSLWGFDFTGEQVVGFAFVYIIASVLIIIIVPLLTVRDRKENLTIDEQAKLFDLRSKSRQVVVQIIGGVLVVATFIGTLQTIRSNDDAFNQKKAELFAKSVKDLVAGQSSHESRTEAMYVLSYVARSDRSYHRPVFDALAAYIVSNKQCGEKKKVVLISRVARRP